MRGKCEEVWVALLGAPVIGAQGTPTRGGAPGDARVRLREPAARASVIVRRRVGWAPRLAKPGLTTLSPRLSQSPV
jgi:hypothetical protein